MGCGSAKSAVTTDNKPFSVLVNDTWTKAMGTLEVKKGKKNPHRNLIIKRSGWKTIRIFVSSTFKDFHPEREVLVKKVIIMLSKSVLLCFFWHTANLRNSKENKSCTCQQKLLFCQHHQISYKHFILKWENWIV